MRKLALVFVCGLSVNAQGIVGIQPISGTVTANAGTGNFTVIQGTASSLKSEIVGNIASAATDSGNPVKVAGKYNSTPPTFTDGQRGDLQLDASGLLRVRLVTSDAASGGTSSNFGSAFPTPGTAAGFNDGTNMQGARVVDLDTGGGTFYGLTTNLVKRTSGTPTELIGQAAMAASLPVVLASDQASIPVTGSGNFSVVGTLADNAANPSTKVATLPGVANAANPSWTEARVVPVSVDLAGYMRVVQKNFGCGTTPTSIAFAAITDTSTAPTGFAATTCLSKLAFTNITASAHTVTVTDGQGTPVTLIAAASIPGNTTVILDMGGLSATTGIKWNADANASIVASANGWQ